MNEMMNQNNVITQEEILNDFINAKELIKKFDKYNVLEMAYTSLCQITEATNREATVDYTNGREAKFNNQFIMTRRVIINNIFDSMVRSILSGFNDYICDLITITNIPDKEFYYGNYIIPDYINNQYGTIDIININSYISDIINQTNINEIAISLIITGLSTSRYKFDYNKINKNIYDIADNLVNILNYFGYFAHACCGAMFPGIIVHNMPNTVFPNYSNASMHSNTLIYPYNFPYNN